MEQRVSIERMEEAINLFGSFDENIRLLEAEFHVTVVNRDGELRISGEPEEVMMAAKAVEALLTLSGKGESITEQHVRYVIGLCRSGQSERIGELTQDVICITSKGRPVKPKTIGQKQYVQAVLHSPVTIGVGPAGTGKTYLAVAAAVAAFRAKQVNRIILTRPAVEAGERLGFLPGDLQSKVDPYLRPLYDALFDMLGAETYQKYLERGNIEVAPLAYMRGRTLDDSFIILDEAQNTSRDQYVPDPHGLRLQNGHHRRHHPDRPAGGQAQRSEGRHEDPEGRGGRQHLPADPAGRGAPCDGAADHRGLRPIRGEAQMRKTHYIPITADVPGAANDANCALIRRTIRTALAAEGLTAPCEVDVLFTDDEGIHAINLEQRGVDRPTDVLSFPMFQLTPGAPPTLDDVEADPGTGLVPLGDMVLSLERAEAQGAEYGHGAEREAAYLAVHSVLHLLGYDHLDEGPMKAQMREREEAILAALGITREGADG